MLTVMNLSSIDLNLLLVLHTMLEESSVNRTARRLNVTSSAISNALARLRDLFDDPLFVRSGRGVVPTPRALQMQDELTRVIGGIEQMIAVEARDPSETRRVLTLALPDSDQVTRLPGLVKRMSTAMPKATLEVVSIDTLLSRGGLERGGASAAMGPQPPRPAMGMHYRHLYDERGVLVVRQGHPLLRKRKDRRAFFEELRHVDVHIALGGRGLGHDLAEQELEQHRIRRDIAVTVPTFTAAAMVAAASDLVAGVPERMVDVLQTSPRLVILDDFTPPGLSFPMFLTWHDRTDLDPVERAFRGLIEESFGRASGRARSSRAAR